MPELKEMIELAKKLEIETLEKGDEVMMKVFAIQKDGASTVIAFANYDPDKRNDLMQGVGIKLWEQMGDQLESLMFVSDAFMAKADLNPGKMSPAELIIWNDVQSGKRRLEDLPPELHKFRMEGLVIVTSQNFGKEVRLTVVPHHLEKGTLIFEKEWSDKKSEDNVLSNVWKGYALAKVAVDKS